MSRFWPWAAFALGLMGVASPAMATAVAVPPCFAKTFIPAMNSGSYKLASNGDGGIGQSFAYCAYVTNYLSNSVSVIDTGAGSVVATVPVGLGPYGIAVSPDSMRIYVANYASNSVSVIAAETRTVIATIPVQTRPYGIAVSPDGSRVYVAAYFSNTVSVIDTQTEKVVATIPVGQRPHGIVVAPIGNKAFVANYADNSVSVLNTLTNKLASTIKLPAGSNPMGLALSPDGLRLAVTGYSSNTAYVIRTDTLSIVATVPVGSHPFGLAFSPDESLIYVANYSGSADTGITSIHTSDYSTSTIPLPSGVYPIGVTFDPNSSAFAYVVSYSDGQVYVINVNSGTVVNQIPVGNRPYGFGVFMGAPALDAWDPNPPNISNLAPADGSLLPATATPTVTAQFSPYDPPGYAIDLTTIHLLVDHVDVTAQATVTPTGISYAPKSWGTGVHDVLLDVPDVYGQTAVAQATFTIVPPPQVAIVGPLDGQKITDPYAQVTANIAPGINGTLDPSKTRLTIDGVDVTAHAGTTPTSINYLPSSAWAAGAHSVTLSLADTLGDATTQTWSFTYNPAPTIYGESPENVYMTDPSPRIKVLLQDAGDGINLGATNIAVDGTDMTGAASVSATQIVLTPAALTPGVHKVTVHTAGNLGAEASKIWSFTILPIPDPPSDPNVVRTPMHVNTSTAARP